MKWSIYRGAGILFLARDHSGKLAMLLGRRRSGVWSIPGGARNRMDASAVDTAWRETHEEFGPLPANAGLPEQLLTFSYPFSCLGFSWKTIVVMLPTMPDEHEFPSPAARDFHVEFTRADWFLISSLPPRTHLLLYPVIWRLKISGYH